MKKVADRHTLLLSTLLMSTGFVVASPGNSPFISIFSSLWNIIAAFLNFMAPLFTTILGPEFSATGAALTSAFLVNLLLFLLIFSIVFMTAGRMPFVQENEFVRWVVTFAVTVLATRWFVQGGGWVEAVLLPYGVLGVSIAALLPLIIFFWVVEVGLEGPRYRTLRKACWIFFFVVYVVMYSGRVSTLSQTAGAEPTTAFAIYPMTAILCILFFLFDGTIQKWMFKSWIRKTRLGANKRIVRDLELEAVKIRKLLADSTLNTNSEAAKQYREDLKNIEEQIADYKAKGFSKSKK